MADGVVRVAEALLQGVGGRRARLRWTTPGSSGDVVDEMGLRDVGFQDVELGPAAFRKAGSERALVVSAGAVERLAGTMAVETAEALFAGAVGVVVDGAVFGIEASVAMRAMGTVYAYALTLRARAA